MRRLNQPIFVVLFISLVLVYTTNAGPTPPDRDDIVVNPNDDSPWEELSNNQDDNGPYDNRDSSPWKHVTNLIFHSFDESLLSFGVIINRNFIVFSNWDVVTSKTKDETNKHPAVRSSK